MSDRLVRSDFEDVMSSIKRLVSQRNDAADAPAGQIAGAQKLVLTPSLLVPVSDPVESQAEPHPVETPQVLESNGSDAPTAAANAPATQPVFLHRPQASKASALEATIAELEAAVAAYDGAWEPDGADEILLGHHDPAEPFIADRPTSPAPANGRAAAHVPGMAEAAKVMPLRTEAQVAPPETPQNPEAMPETGTAEAAGSPAAFSGVEEAVLREIVLQVVREELQGDLGVRITRNVRKLVRREIYRILEMEGLE